MKHRGMVVLVGDSRTALSFDNRGTTLHARLHQRRVLRAPANPPTREQGTDRPGRSFQSVGSRRSALEQTDWYRLGENHFTRAIAVALEELHTTRILREIMLVAPLL
jgi:protein required for attachment to host cells